MAQRYYNMKIIINKHKWLPIPFPTYKAINLFGVLIVRSGKRIRAHDLNHEEIHTAQMKELWYVFFYLWYVTEWLVRLFMKGNAYRNISFEREAYANEEHIDYLENRKRFAWIKYIKN